MEPFRTRLAPTPSGLLHPGNGLSFLMTWAIARANGGAILLRIDDLDKERYRAEYVEDIFRTVEWLGIDFDEGPGSVADFEQNWSQHHRLDDYHQALTQLKDAGQLFPCQWSRKEIRALSPDGRYPYTARSQNLSFNDPQTAWRVLAPPPAAQASLNSWQQEKQHISLASIDAFIVKQKNDLPAYQIASLLDDELYRVNFIVRGQDLWESTLSQLYLAQLLGKKNFLATRFYHHPLILDDEGRKLSKSKGAGSLKAWREAGKSTAGLFAMAGQQLGINQEVVNGQQLVDAIKDINNKKTL